MKLPRFRITLRRLMIALAIFGILLAYGDRWRRYKKLAEYHRQMGGSALFSYYSVDLPREGEGQGVKETQAIDLNGQMAGHRAKSREYDYASLRSWLSVSPEVVPVSPEVVPADSVSPTGAAPQNGPGPSPFENP